MKRPLLLPLVPLYAAGLAWKHRRLEQGEAPARRLEAPVISVGSLSAGGAGKTPFLIALGHALGRAGFAVDVLSRGYGRRSKATARVAVRGSADDYGDEPLLLAEWLRRPVYVGRQRFDAGALAEADRRAEHGSLENTLHLLDDGFQHRQLARAVDIVLLTAEDARDTLLPAGNLREPLRAMRRADILVLRDEEAEALRPVLQRVFAERPVPALWTIGRHAFPIEKHRASKPLAFCGIARPEGFRAALRSYNVDPVAFVALHDHQRYDERLLRRLQARGRAAGANGFITTDKDAVKLTPALRAMLDAPPWCPLSVLSVAVELHDGDAAIAQLKSLLRKVPADAR